jgi:hypothetical protein
MNEQSKPQPVSSTPPLIPAPTAPMKTSQALTVILVLLVLFLGGGLIYLGYQNLNLQKQIVRLTDQQLVPVATPTPITTNAKTPIPTYSLDLTANWKSYQLDQLKVNFKYPPTWLEQQGEGGTQIVSPDGKSKLLIIGVARTAQTTTKSALHNYLETATGYTGQGLVYLSEKEFDIGPNKGWWVDVRLNALNQEDQLFMVEDMNNSHMYQGLSVTNVTKDLQTQVDQIFSSFKFL